MTDNPYSTESSNSKDVSDSTTVQEVSSRPLGITALAVLSFFPGLLIVATAIAMPMPRSDEAIEVMNYFGTAPWLLTMGLLFLGTLAIVSGVGMWLGASWGWQCTAFYFTLGISRHISGLIHLIVFSIQHELTETSTFTNRQMTRIIVHGLVLFYLFRPNVLQYFGLGDMNKKAVFYKLIVIGIGIFLLPLAIDQLLGFFVSR